MWKLKNMPIAIAILSVILSVIIFTSCQKEPNPVESQDATQQQLSKFTLPAGATFQSATFNIHLWQWAGNGVYNKDISVYRITSPWQEMVVTWGNFGGKAPEVWGLFNVPNTIGWYSVNVTTLVGSWLNGTNPNYGLLLDGVPYFPRCYFNSRENSYNGTIGDAPYLNICYKLNGVTVCEQIEPIADATIWEIEPNTNLGADESLYCGMYGESNVEWKKQPIVMFDFEATPPPPQIECETAYAYGQGNSLSTLCFLNIPNKQGDNWGWTNKIGPGTYNWPIYAGAGQCDISKGTLVGTLNVVYAGGTVTITYNMDPGYTLGETHVWVGSETNLLPKKSNGKWDSAPGQFNHNGVNPVVVSGLTGNIWIAAHSGVCWEVQ